MSAITMRHGSGAKIFAVNFLIGVVTGIPMEFQFGTNWSHFSRMTGGVIGQPLAMEGVFSFFLESTFLGLFLFGEKRLSKWAHWGAAFMVFVGSWISGYFIIVTNAWMQHPVAYKILPNGTFEITSFYGAAAESVGAAAVCAYDVRGGGDGVVRDGVGGCVLSAGKQICGVCPHLLKDGGDCGLHRRVVLMIFPTGDMHGRLVAERQAATMAAMEGLFHTEKGAGVAIMGQPNEQTQTLDNPLVVNNLLSFLIYGTTSAQVQGLDHFPRENWPQPMPLLYYSYHIMAGLGTYFVALMGVSAFLLWRGKLYTTRWILWPLMLSFPLPYVATTAGWMTAEIGRQPWVVYGLMRTEIGYFEVCLGRECSVYAAGVYGNVYGFGDSLFAADLSGD